MKRLALTLILLSLTTLFLGACHTVAGVGKDVQSAGDAIEGASGKD
ncbi:MAG: entericidin A/B family lipoprotein [Arenimonas sp.]|nr:entericidin A/B family lipoprotein [Arenimonas sp.]